MDVHYQSKQYNMFQDHKEYEKSFREELKMNYDYQPLRIQRLPEDQDELLSSRYQFIIATIDEYTLTNPISQTSLIQK